MAGPDYARALGAGVVAFSTDGRSDFHYGGPACSGSFALTVPQISTLRDNGLASPAGVIFPKQVHGDAVWMVSGDEVAERGGREADAVVTARTGVPIAVRTADCLPLLLFAPRRRVVAAVHAGWNSTLLGIARRTVGVLRGEYGVDPAALRAVVGPCIRRDSYQVGEEFRRYFPEDVRVMPGGLYLDLPAANIRQLLQAGMAAANIYDSGLDTFSDPGLHSFRRDGERAGRLIHVIMLA